jgi:hypothetical protein
MPSRTAPRSRGYLMHLTHYDPRWTARKKREQPWDLELALEVVEALGEEGFNVLVVDCADAVKYKSHPEFARRYTRPMRDLRKLAAAAQRCGLEVAPKLNFARGEINTHNHWMRAPGETWYAHFDDETYWKTAFEVVDELVAACESRRFFHIGMDEDHDRSYTQYAEAVTTLHAGLRKRRLQTLVWNDSGIKYASGLIHAEKSLFAEQHLPKSITQVLWQYGMVPEADIRRIREEGFPLWGAPGWRRPEQVIGFRDAVLAAGGNGLLMTTWSPLKKSNRAALLTGIRRMGPIYRGEE